MMHMGPRGVIEEDCNVVRQLAVMAVPLGNPQDIGSIGVCSTVSAIPAIAAAMISAFGAVVNENAPERAVRRLDGLF